MSEASEPLILVERHGARADVILNRPERKNSFTHEMADQLRDALRLVGSDESVGAIVLRGTGGFFCSGVDLKAAGDGTRPSRIEAWPEVHAAIMSSRAPIVMALEKYAINAGASLVLGSHITVMGESAFLQVGERAIGSIPAACQAWLELRHTRAVAERVVFIADRMPAHECLRMNLVSEVVPDDQVVARAVEIADAIAGHPVDGRRSVAGVWAKLREPIADPVAWFRDKFDW